MKYISAFMTLIFSILLFSTALNAASYTMNRFTLPSGGKFEVTIKDNWHANMQGKEDEGGYAIRFTPPKGTPLIMLLTPLPEAKDGANLKEFIDNYSLKIKQRMQNTSVERELTIHELQGLNSKAKYVSMTDKSVTKPSNTDFKYGIQGIGYSENVLFTFTILSNEKDAPARIDALKIVSSARYIPQK